MDVYEWFDETVSENRDDEAFCRALGAELVADGQLTQAQADEILSRAFGKKSDHG